MDDERTKVNGLFERLTFPPFFKGARIKLRDETWAVAVENCLKGLAFGFCCTDNHDALVLRGLMKGLCPPNKIPQIIVSKFQVFKTEFRCFWQVEIDYICAHCISCCNFAQLIRKNCAVLRVKVTRSQDGCAKDGDYFTIHVSPNLGKLCYAWSQRDFFGKLRGRGQLLWKLLRDIRRMIIIFSTTTSVVMFPRIRVPVIPHKIF